MSIYLTTDTFGNVELTLDASDPAPNSPEPVSCFLSEADVKLLIKQLYEAFPSIETPAQALHKGYQNAKAHIQFPVCACHFADDEETLISPCMAHLDWAKQRQIPRGVFVVAMQRAFDMGSRHEDHLLKDRPWDLERATQIWEDYKQLVEATYKRLNGEQA